MGRRDEATGIFPAYKNSKPLTFILVKPRSIYLWLGLLRVYAKEIKQEKTPKCSLMRTLSDAVSTERARITDRGSCHSALIAVTGYSDRFLRMLDTKRRFRVYDYFRSTVSAELGYTYNL